MLTSRLRFALVKPDKDLMERRDPQIKKWPKNQEHLQPAHTRNVLIFAAAFTVVTLVTRFSSTDEAHGCMQTLALDANSPSPLCQGMLAPSCGPASQQQQPVPRDLLQGLLGLPRERSPPQTKVGDRVLASSLCTHPVAPML